MERLFQNVKDGILNFKLNLCCFVARVRVGIILFGYFNIITSTISLISVTSSSFPSLYMHAQQTIMDGEYVPSSSAIANCVELSISVLLLCGVYREDIVLLRYFTYAAACMAAGTLLVYTMVIDVLDLLSTILVVMSLIYQMYLILLVRSFIVEIKQPPARNGYVINLRSSVIENVDYGPEEKYSVVIEPETLRPSETLPETEDVAIPETIATVEDSEVPGPSNETVTSYPFKFVAIKIPKGKTIEDANKEGLANEGANKEGIAIEGDSKEETDKKEKETVVKEGEIETKDIIKPPKRSIFSRKKKLEKSKTKVDESKKA